MRIDDLPGSLTQPGLGELAQLRIVRAGRVQPPPPRQRRRRRPRPAAARGSRPARRRRAPGRTGPRPPPAAATSARRRLRAVVGDHDVAEPQRREQLVVGELGLDPARPATSRCGPLVGGWSGAEAGVCGASAPSCREPRSGSSTPGPERAADLARVARGQQRRSAPRTRRRRRAPPRRRSARASRARRVRRRRRRAGAAPRRPRPARGSRCRDRLVSASRSASAS